MVRSSQRVGAPLSSGFCASLTATPAYRPPPASSALPSGADCEPVHTEGGVSERTRVESRGKNSTAKNFSLRRQPRTTAKGISREYLAAKESQLRDLAKIRTGQLRPVGSRSLNPAVSIHPLQPAALYTRPFAASRRIRYKISAFDLAHLMAMNLNGTQIPAGEGRERIGVRGDTIAYGIRAGGEPPR